MTPTPTPRREPRTDSGRRLAAVDWDDGVNRRPAERSFGNFNRMADVVAAIEADAAVIQLIRDKQGDTPVHQHIEAGPPVPANGYAPSNYARCACGAWFKWFVVGQHRYGSIGAEEER